MTAGQVATRRQVISCKVRYKKVAAPVNPAGLTELFAKRSLCCILGGNSADTEANRFSYWMAEPKEVFEFGAGEKDPFGKLERALNKYRPAEDVSRGFPAGA